MFVAFVNWNFFHRAMCQFGGLTSCFLCRLVSLNSKQICSAFLCPKSAARQRLVSCSLSHQLVRQRPDPCTRPSPRQLRRKLVVPQVVPGCIGSSARTARDVISHARSSPVAMATLAAQLPTQNAWRVPNTIYTNDTVLRFSTARMSKCSQNGNQQERSLWMW